jgi:hypothetical protein
MRASGSRVSVNADANLVVRVEEFFYSYKQASAANTQASELVRGGITNIGGALPAIFGNNVNPAGATLVEVAGRHILNIATGAAVLTRGTNVGDVCAIPIGQEFQTAGAIPIAALGRPLRQYTLTVPVRRTVAGTAVMEFGIGTNVTNILTLQGLTPPAVVWSSNPAVNAGRFLPRSRRVNAGAITDGPDSQIAPDTNWHLLGFRYTEGLVPVVEWLIDGLAMHLISGDAAMLDFPGGVNAPGFVPAYGVGTPAGSTWQFGAGAFEVRNIGV